MDSTTKRKKITKKQSNTQKNTQETIKVQTQNSNPLQSNAPLTTRPDAITAIQINLHGGRKATQGLISYIEANNIQVAFLQDFHQNKKTGKISGVNYKNWSVAKTTGNKSAIITHLGTNPLILKEMTYATAILLENSKETITAINIYAPPSAELKDVLEEIEEVLKISKGEILLVGDFNAHSQQWGYEDIDQRGNELTSFLLMHALFVQNPPGAPPPSFHTMRGNRELKGWPDLTISTVTLGDNIHDWEVSDEESHSDHKFIKFKIKYDNDKYHRHRLETKHGKHTKFDKGIRKIKNRYIKELRKTNTRTELDRITLKLQNEIKDIAFSCYKQRRTPELSAPKWWTEELKTARNRVRAHRRRFQKQTTEDERLKYHVIYKKEKAKLKKLIGKIKTKTWIEYCEEIKNVYGAQYRLAAGKNSRPAILTNILPNNERVTVKKTLNHFLDTLYLTDPSIPHKLQQKLPDIAEGLPPTITKQELNRIIRNIKQNKAPGFDYIDYNLIKRIHNVAPNLLLTLLNTCLMLNYVPRSFKLGIVVLFPKPGKDHKNAKNYRPICLLPALSKLLERIIHGRINHHLTVNNYWSEKQYGFKQGKSTEHALRDLLKQVKEDKQNKKQTLLISMDISGAFDNIRWPLIIEKLKNSPCPTYLTNLIISYLEDRFVKLEENGIGITKQTYGGCPQGSCLGPLLWLIIADIALRENWGDNVKIQAFADDFILILSALTKDELVQLANRIIKIFNEWTTKHNLNLNWDKTELLYLNREHTRNLPTANTYVLDGIKIGNKELKTQEQIKYLGVIIDKNLNWIKHCQNQVKKINNSFRMLRNMVSRGWGVKPEIIKIWYRTVVEKTLVYAAPIWGHSITKTSKENLLSCQRHFALTIVRAYRTAPTAALLVLAGLIPIHLQVKYEASYGSVSRLRDTITIHGKTINHTDYDTKINIWKRHPAETIEPQIGYTESDMIIYTDGSKLESGATGSAFVAYKNDEKVMAWSRPLRKCNSVFQAELLAIKHAAIWGNTQGQGYSVRSDCMSAIQALSKPYNTNNLIDEIQTEIKKSNNNFKISWVKAHVGIQGNEEADNHAKQAAINENNEPKHYLVKPTSYLKKLLKQLTMDQWQFEWDYGDTGRLTHKFFPQVDKTRLVSCKLLSQLYTGHGAFPAYLHRFKKKTSPQCDCGMQGTVHHYLTACPLTQAHHLASITQNNEKLWYKQLAQNRHVQNKGKIVVRWLTENINDISN